MYLDDNHLFAKLKYSSFYNEIDEICWENNKEKFNLIFFTSSQDNYNKTINEFLYFYEMIENVPDFDFYLSESLFENFEKDLLNYFKIFHSDFLKSKHLKKWTLRKKEFNKIINF